MGLGLLMGGPRPSPRIQAGEVKKACADAPVVLFRAWGTRFQGLALWHSFFSSACFARSSYLNEGILIISSYLWLRGFGVSDIGIVSGFQTPIQREY